MAVRIIPAQQNMAEGGMPGDDRELRVAAYARVSTDGEDQETSYDAQIAHYTEYISGHPGWVFAGVFADEGISGTSTAKREQFIKLIKACEDGEIDMVITKSISRWARNTIDSLNYIRKLKDLGIPVLFEKEGINTMGTTGELLITIMSSLAQQESQSISQNVRIGLQYGFQKGKPMLVHTRFLGYTKQRGDMALSIVPEEADIVRMIFRDFVEGYSLGEIAHDLTERGIQTPGNGKKWQLSTLQSMLKNEKYMGDLLLQKTYVADFLTKKSKKNDGRFPQYYVENAHPPIVPKEIFMRVQGTMLQMEYEKQVNGKHSQLSNKNALFGKIVCSECGERYKRYKENGALIWRCCTRILNRNGCAGRVIMEEEVTGAMVQAFNLLPKKRDELIRMQERIMWGPLDRLDREIKEIDECRDELEKAISDYAATGHLEQRLIILYCESDEEEADEETAAIKIAEKISELKNKHDALLCEKSELSVQEANIQTLFKMTNAILGLPIETRELLKTGTDNESATAQDADPAACYDLYDFYQRTDNITQRGPVREYDNALARRIVDKFIVNKDGIDVRFKAGITIFIKTPAQIVEAMSDRKHRRKKRAVTNEY